MTEGFRNEVSSGKLNLVQTGKSEAITGTLQLKFKPVFVWISSPYFFGCVLMDGVATLREDLHLELSCEQAVA